MVVNCSMNEGFGIGGGYFWIAFMVIVIMMFGVTLYLILNKTGGGDI